MIALSVHAVGRLRGGPERALVDDYLMRAEKAGRGVGIGPVSEVQIDDRKGGGMAAEAALLAASLPEGAVICALDERGQALSSPDLAARIGDWRDQGRRGAAFVIGGADGLSPGLREGADLVLSFGPMVWPHMLARVMVAEQLYRATQIFAGTPYHRT